MTEEEVLRLFETCSNAGRWGPDDERGTLNYVTREKRLEALALVRDGDSVSIGRDLILQPPQESGPVNALTKAHVEVDGKAHADWTREFSYREIVR